MLMKKPSSYGRLIVRGTGTISTDIGTHAVEIFYSFDDKEYTMMRNC